MPSRNIVKEYAANSYYHVYSRGVNKQPIFLDAKDFEVFISLFKRYLSKSPQTSPKRIAFPHYSEKIELLSYCIMPNHFHILIYQNTDDAMSKFMRSLLTSYSMYFNKRYNRVGPVFQSRYKAVRIDDSSYFTHISRYIHMNPKDWVNYPYSSLNHLRGIVPEWLHPQQYMNEFSDISDYLKFLKEYQESKEEFDLLKWQLANGHDPDSE